MKYFKIYEEGWDELTTNAKLVYIAIACNCDLKKHTSQIRREKIQQFTGINRSDISALTNELCEKNWLTKDVTEIKGDCYKTVLTYHLIDRGNFKFVDTQILYSGLSKMELITFVSLCLLLDEDGEFRCTKPYTCIGISPASYYRSLKTLKEKGFVTGGKGEIIISDYLWKPEIQLTQENKEFEKWAISSENDNPELKGKVLSLIEKEYAGIVNPNSLLDGFRLGFGLDGNKKIEMPTTTFGYNFE